MFKKIIKQLQNSWTLYWQGTTLEYLLNREKYIDWLQSKTNQDILEMEKICLATKKSYFDFFG